MGWGNRTDGDLNPSGGWLREGAEEAMVTKSSEPSRLRDVLMPATLVALLFGGYVKASPLLAWIPIDLTLLAAAAVAMSAAVIIVGSSSIPKGLAPLVVLAAASVPAAMLASPGAYADRKILYLFGLTLPCGIAAGIIVSNRARLWWFMRWSVVAALGMALLVRMSAPSEALYGRYVLADTNTIAVGRGAGAGLVALVVLLLARKIQWWLAVPSAVALVVVIFGSGSRGPLLAAAAGLIAVVLARPSTHRVRDVIALLIVGGFVAGQGLANTNGAAAERILLLFSSADRGQSVGARESLYQQAADVVTAHFVGVGWGGLEGTLSPVAAYPHNILLEVFAEGGWVVGLVFFGALFISLVRIFRGKAEVANVAVLAVLVYWMMNAMVSGDINDNRGVFVLLGIALVLPVALAGEVPVEQRSGSKR